MPDPAVPARRARCYVASPLGFTEAGRFYHERAYLPALATVVDPVDPWALTDAAEVAAARAAGRERELALTIGRRNIDAIRSCSLLAALLDGQEPDAGTVAEVGYAAGLGMPCFGLRTDLRQSGEAGVSVNLQVETLVVDSGGVIARSLDELVAALARAAGLERPAPGSPPRVEDDLA
jgi:nucleoside 2-deoxyribosyltransferase